LNAKVMHLLFVPLLLITFWHYFSHFFGHNAKHQIMAVQSLHLHQEGPFSHTKDAELINVFVRFVDGKVSTPEP
jgi:hypothetical protein